jgi:uncharacterized phage-like protein YoqJ
MNPTPEWLMVYRSLYQFILRGIKAGYTDWLVGGALGVDMLAGLALADIVTKHKDVTGWLCIPHPDYNNRWAYDRDRQDLDLLKTRLNTLVLIDTGKFNISMLHSRNEFMVNHTAITCAVYDGRGKGGTMKCKQYAQTEQKRVCVMDAYKVDPTTGYLKETW